MTVRFAPAPIRPGIPGADVASGRRTFATTQAPEADRELAGGAGIRVGRRASRRDEFEVVGFLFGICIVLVMLAVTIGVAPPI
jgi:hypothetical protein